MTNLGDLCQRNKEVDNFQVPYFADFLRISQYEAFRLVGKSGKSIAKTGNLFQKRKIYCKNEKSIAKTGGAKTGLVPEICHCMSV